MPDLTAPTSTLMMHTNGLQECSYCAKMTVGIKMKPAGDLGAIVSERVDVSAGRAS